MQRASDVVEPRGATGDGQHGAKMDTSTGTARALLHGLAPVFAFRLVVVQGRAVIMMRAPLRGTTEMHGHRDKTSAEGRCFEPRSSGFDQGSSALRNESATSRP